MFSDAYLEERFVNGELFDAYNYFGNHRISRGDGNDAVDGVLFRVFAPNAGSVRVAGDFNGWGNDCVDGDMRSGLMARSDRGVWEAFVPGRIEGSLYKYEITDRSGNVFFKNDPFAISAELRPGTASVVCDIPDRQWQDGDWLSRRASENKYEKPVNIYELHLGSWRRGNIPGIDYKENWQEAERRKSEEPFLNYREIADQLSVYLSSMHYTHVELMPVCEHPLDGSWGYQTGSYYALTSRFGTPEDFMYFVDRMHTCGIGVIMDWVPGHFCRDVSWLYRFDGSYLYEYEQENKRENPLWGTANFDYSRPWSMNFMVSNAVYWLKEYHLDGLRIDAVANIIYFDYNEMHPVRPRNGYGGFENIEGIRFLKNVNTAVHQLCPGAVTVAEDSSTYPGMTGKVSDGGVGFDFKWNMGWMNDTLKYMSESPQKRHSDHNKMNFAMMYAHTERFLLSLSHDESVHGKKTLLDKMYGNLEDKFAQFRSFLLYMICHPGKKLLFMGSEFGQIMEWRYYESLEWKMLLYPPHGLLHEYVKALNGFYLGERALYAGDYSGGGFRWIDADDSKRSVYSFVRSDPADDRNFLVVVCNFSPETYRDLPVGVPRFCDYKTVFESYEREDEDPVASELVRPSPEGAGSCPFRIKTDIKGYGAKILKPVFRF
jgi:1,4-alpha-glucan branching enzyme